MTNHFVAAFVTIYITLDSFATCSERFYVEESVRRIEDYYWVNQTEITLVCKPHDDATDICISEVLSSCQSTVHTADGNDGNEHRLSVKKPVHLSQFVCQWNNPRWCIKWIGCLFESEEVHSLRLWVIESSGRDDVDCTLLNDLVVGGKAIFFAGDNIMFSCHEEGLNVSLMKDNNIFQLAQPVMKEKTEVETYLFTIPNIRFTHNGSLISCTDEYTEGEDIEDYCKHFSQIIVYESIDIRIVPSALEILNGDNVTLICRSELYELASDIEFYILGDITFTNWTRKDITGGEKIRLRNVNISSSVLVVCEVTIGSRSANASVALYREIHSTTFSMETISNELPTTNGSGLLSKMKSGGSPVIPIVIPVVLVLVMIFVLVVIILCRISSSKKRTATESEASGNGDAVPPADINGQTSDVYYYVDNNGKVDMGLRHGISSTEPEVRDEDSSAYRYVDANDKAKLGLAQGDSEVADNIAYMSYY